jgi:hypothetical protein
VELFAAFLLSLLDHVGKVFALWYLILADDWTEADVLNELEDHARPKDIPEPIAGNYDHVGYLRGLQLRDGDLRLLNYTNGVSVEIAD